MDYSYEVSLYNLLDGFNPGETIKYHFLDSIDKQIEIAETIRKKAIEKRNHFSSIIKDGKNFPYYEEGKRIEEKVGEKVDFTYQVALYNALISLAREIKANLIDIKEGKRTFSIDLDQFKACFDLDTMLLMLSKYIIANANIFMKNHNFFVYGLIEVKQYITMVQAYNVEGYNPTIRYYDEKTKRIARYSFQNLCADLARIERNHPEFTTFQVSTENMDKLELKRDIDALKRLAKVRDEQSLKVLKADWEILPAGERDAQVEKYTKEKAESYIEKLKDSREKELKPPITQEDILFRKYVYEQTPYKLRIVGTEDFFGYVGYVYENGLFFFERFYEDQKEQIPAQNRATYVMNYDTFFKKLSRQEFMDLIKSTDDPSICRLYHTETWHTRLKQKIKSIKYTEESKMLIEVLLQEETLKKRLQ